MTSGFSPARMKHRQPLAQQASAPAAAGQALGTATLSHGCLLTFAPDTCILRVTSLSSQARMPMIFQSLEGILFGSQCCAWMLLCLAHHEWLHVVLCNKACHDYVRERASASAIRLPSDPPRPPTGATSSDTVPLPRAQCLPRLSTSAILLPISAITGSSMLVVTFFLFGVQQCFHAGPCLEHCAPRRTGSSHACNT